MPLGGSGATHVAMMIVEFMAVNVQLVGGKSGAGGREELTHSRYNELHINTPQTVPAGSVRTPLDNSDRTLLPMPFSALTVYWYSTNGMRPLTLMEVLVMELTVMVDELVACLFRNLLLDG